MPQAFAEQFRSISMSSNLGASLERAHGFSRAQAHRSVLLEHLLLALIEDPDASGVLRTSNVDVVRLGTDVSDYLGRLMEDMRAEPGTEPRPDAELLRVLHAAGQAAQQSRRRQIDGAIVLAAVVGDGKSPAAGILKTLGLGFDEAIRALQKASAQARSKQFSSPPPAVLRQAATATASEAPAAPSIATPTPAPPVEPPAGEALPPEAPQTVEEILAAARARIQRRTAATVGRPEPTPPAAPAPAPESFSLGGLAPPADSAEAIDPQEAQEPETVGFDAAGGTPAPPRPSTRTDAGPILPSPPQPAWTPTSPLPNPAARLPHPGSGHKPSPFPPRVQGREGARPPLPGRAGPPSAPQPGLPNRLPAAPWPDATEPISPGRPSTNGAAGAAQTVRPAGLRQGQRPGAGPLVETIPRRMRVGVPAPANVRISRDKIDGLILLLLGQRGHMRPDAFLMRALTVRLVAPDGGFWIETGPQETQWFEATASGVQQDDHATWRWTVVPQRRGRHRLLLLVSVRTVGRDGLAAETSPPDRVIEVTVKGGAGQRVLRWMRVLAVLVAGALIGRFGSEFWAMGATALRRFLG